MGEIIDRSLSQIKISIYRARNKLKKLVKENISTLCY
ncbi:MAG: hypothetical protein GX023_04135 [Tissierellia bacterium]|nr:hypothetical protein [Tissierellia bacterium]